LIAALFVATSFGDRARAGGRSPAEVGGLSGGEATRPTIESVSAEAQREIRACPDSAAISCVAAALTHYVEALRTVSPPPPPEGLTRRKHCGGVSGLSCRAR
jgi:hypothetical protein